MIITWFLPGWLVWTSWRWPFVQVYPSLDAARQAGVPEEHLAEVEVEIVRIASGPFKGRVYERHPQSRQLTRRKDLEAR